MKAPRRERQAPYEEASRSQRERDDIGQDVRKGADQ